MPPFFQTFSRRELLITSTCFLAVMAAALLLAEQREPVLFYKILYTARATMILFTPAICLYVLPGYSQSRRNYWLLFWTFSFLSYAIHLYYAFVIFFHGSLREFFAAQGMLVATINLIITIWWAFDIMAVWTRPFPAWWLRLQRGAIQIIIAVTFFASTVILHGVDNKEPFVVVLGVLQAAAILAGVAIRVVSHARRLKL
ncbi:MAG: hypothetical protein ONB48_04265 [candidate division KSB1 bacterium]|nr:hypothetical protein [candidate division KSB1 bacterium]MDZ7274475.1 hypothetical protein [candidate division KSB1 bacterium]MDZ7284863.1 hypothetical protein [candidate division KSB1 bacterium]MDZ7297717.1 hypothetical protein [candidate division KSB1 bacterium]MDZ7308970.1 hypothetical protein [candidate division KSB1 bacterium]